MTDDPATPKLRRRWKRRVAFVLVVAICGGLWMRRDSEMVRRARQLRLGMTSKEVGVVMGPPSNCYRSGPGGGWGKLLHPSLNPRSNVAGVDRFATAGELQRCRLVNRVAEELNEIGFPKWTFPMRYPVSVQYDELGIVVSILRGSEMVVEH